MVKTNPKSGSYIYIICNISCMDTHVSHMDACIRIYIGKCICKFKNVTYTTWIIYMYDIKIWWTFEGIIPSIYWLGDLIRHTCIKQVDNMDVNGFHPYNSRTTKWVDARLSGSLLWHSDIFFLGTFCSNVYGNEYIYIQNNWQLNSN